MAPIKIQQHLVNGGAVEKTGRRYKLIVPPTTSDTYVDAQLDDYEHTLPRHFTNFPPRDLTIKARFSHQSVHGTAGFGFWNHPFAREGAVIAPPCNVWFFYCSPDSDLQVVKELPGYGFKASILNSQHIPGTLVKVGSALFNALVGIPFLAKVLMKAARNAVRAEEVLVNTDLTAWHDYHIRWQSDYVTFSFDGCEILRSLYAPHIPLGFAAWIDNYKASASSDKYQFSYVAVPQEQWMELEIISGDE